MRASISTALLLTAVLALAQHAIHAEYLSPNNRFKALVDTSDGESRVAVLTERGVRLATHAFTSEDKQHGYEVDAAYWTPDGKYFVFRLRSSGGHSPMFAPIA